MGGTIGAVGLCRGKAAEFVDHGGIHSASVEKEGATNFLKS
jgi:hypothetical protein